MVNAINYERRGGGEPVVLVHGIGSRWQVWLPVLDRLAAQYDVVAIDLPGFGLSPRPAAGVVPGAATLARMVSEFASGLGLERPHVVGNSLGGWIALEMARDGAARSAVALSPAGFHSPAEGHFLNASLIATRAACRLGAPYAGAITGGPMRRRLLFAQLIAHPERANRYDAAEAVRGVAGATWFEGTRRALVAERFFAGGPIGVPVTIAWGEKDRLLLPRQAVRAAAQIPSARSVTLTDCGHVPTYDDPDQVTRVILEGIARA